MPADPDLEREIRAELANRLAGESPVSELLHVALSIFAAAVIWPAVPTTQAVAWAAAISLAALLRAVLRARRRKDGADPSKTLQIIRLGVGVHVITWGLGLVLIGPALPFELLSLLSIIMAGIVAGATIALLADPFSFRMMTGGLLAPLAVAIAVNGEAHHNRIGAILVLIYGVSMLVYYRRSHAALLRQLDTAQALRLTTAQAEAERDRAERMVSIIESTTDLVVIATPDGRLLYVNQAGRAMIGVGPEEDVSQMTFRDTSPPRLHDLIEREILPGILRNGTWSGESAVLNRDGSEIPVSAVAIAHRGPGGRVESVSAVARDVTLQTAARNALQTARDAAEQMATAKSAFLANTSHEIRTPLNGILGMVELLLDTELTQAQRRSVELIATSGETLLNTINDVLDLSKIEAGQMELEQVPFDLHHLVHSAVRLLNTRVGDKTVELVSDVGANVPQRVVGDPHRLRQVLTNLIGNAIKFTHQGEVVVSVRRESGERGRARVRLSVHDTGIGIPAEHVERIFQPFGQVDSSTTRHYGGSGLGLSISRRLVSMMGGELQVDSKPGKGSEFRFTVEWPVASDSGADSQRTRGSLRGVRTLIVDDHPVNRRVLVDMLRWAGAEVQAVASVDDALAALRHDVRSDAPLPLVVSDVQMPDRDGFDLASVLRTDDALRQTRIMLLTSGGRPGDEQRCRDLGVAAYMQKPVSRVELVEAALAALAGGPSQPERRSVVTRIKLDETRARLRILVAEDNPVNQEVAASMLRKRGHHVDIVGNGRLAVDAVRRDPTFDVVLMDLQMPEMDGITATREIRALHASKPPIVALTANISNEERERALAAGMNGYLTKPFKASDLFAIVEGWSPDIPAAPEVPPAAAPVDLDGFNAMLADVGIPEAGSKMIDAFLQDAPTRIAEMLDAADAGNLQGVAALAHRLKSGATSIFAHEFARTLREAERDARDGSLASARAAAQKAADEFARVQAYLVKSIGTHPLQSDYKPGSDLPARRGRP
jgi:two-component system sensor histidine kinase/response regulator